MTPNLYAKSAKSEIRASASGNKTDPSLQVPLGDSALGYLGQLLGGLVKGKDTSTATASAAPPSAAASGAACADGACAVPVTK